MIYKNYKFEIPKEKMIRVITNTDAKNEADDQFAIVQTLLSPKFDNVGFIAAHYGIKRDKDSMVQSYKEIETIFEKMNIPKKSNIFKGAVNPMVDTKTPIDSEGAQLIIKEAMAIDDRKLFITFMGPLTDLASAYLIEPRIAGRLTAIWIGGGSYPSGGIEYNLSNDIHAANVVFSSSIDIWQVPKNVYEMMPVSMAELELRVRPFGDIGKYLFDQLQEHSTMELPRKSPFRTGETWVLGDNPCVGLMLYEHRYEFDYIPAPLITQDMNYIHTNTNRPIRVYKNIDSRLILEDMYAKIALFSKNN